jgi:hypothetical protein
VLAAAWRAFAGSNDFSCRSVRGCAPSAGAPEPLIEQALSDPGSRPIAALDAALRLTASLVQSGGLRAGREARRALESLFQRARQPSTGEGTAVPTAYWWATRAEPGADEQEQLLVRGAVLVRVAPQDRLQSLSFNYQRQLFLPPDTEESRLLAGQRITVVELSDGTVQARHAGKLLPLTRFGKDDAGITQGTIVSNKLLAGALQFLKDKQAAKDVEKLSKLRTKRGKRLLEKRNKRALPKDRYPTSLLCSDPDISTLP